MSLWQRCVATVSIRNVLFMTTLRFQSGFVGNKAPKTRAPNENVTRWAHALWHLLALWRMRVARGESHPAHTHISKVSPCLPRIKSIFTLNQKGKGGKSPKETLSLQLVSFVFHFSLAAFFIFIFFFFSVLNVKWQETSTEMCYGLEIFIECLQVLLMSFKVAQVALRLVKMSAKLHSQKVLLFPSNGHEIKPKRNSFSPTYYAHGAVSVKTHQLIRWAFAFYVKLQSLAFVLELKLLDNDWKVVAIRILLI